MRVLKFTDFNERNYDSCLPSYDSMIVTAVTRSISEYSYRGEAAPKYFVQDPLEIDIVASSFKQFPYEGDPKRDTSRAAALVTSYLGGVPDLAFSSDPENLTPVVYPGLKNIVYRVGYQIINPRIATDAQHVNQLMFPYGLGIVQDLSENLVSSYWFTSTLPTGLTDHVNGNNIDITPTTSYGTHPAIGATFGNPVNLSSTSDTTMVFTQTTTRANVQFGEVIGDRDDHKMVDDPASPNNDLPFTISLVIKTTQASGVATQIILERFSTTKREYEVYLDSSLYPTFRLGSDDLNNIKGIRSDTAVQTNTWTHIVCTYDGRGSASSLNSMKIYINGFLTTASNSSGGSYSGIMNCDSAARLRIGAHYSSDGLGPLATSDYDGHIWTINMWKNRVLNATEIYGLYVSEMIGNYKGYVRHRIGEIEAPQFSENFGTPRYGISNTEPQFSSAAWRVDRYGHLRDALEQRASTARNDGFKPVKINFISGSQSVNPMLTYSQNLSTFATSSMPYFDDGVARNRPDDPDQ